MKRVVFCFLCLLFIMGCEKDPALSHMPNVTVVLDTVKLERKVLVIGIDGVRSDVLSPLHTPFLDSIIPVSYTHLTLPTKRIV